MSDSYERVILVKNEIFVYKIPPRQPRGYRAAEWDLDKPIWSGRLRAFAKDNLISLRLEDKDTGALFAQSIVKEAKSVEKVNDSSRYFVIYLQNESGKGIYVGIGFVDRSDAFDFNITIHDHFKSNIETSQDETPMAPLNLALKEGEQIKINLKFSNTTGEKSVTKNLPSQPSLSSNSSALLLPPPPSSTRSNRTRNATSANIDLF